VVTPYILRTEGQRWLHLVYLEQRDRGSTW
jgi:hypothetical protein